MADRTDNRPCSTPYWHGCWMDSVCDRSRAPRSFVDWIAHRLPKEEDLNEDGEVMITNEYGAEKIAVWSGSEFWVNGKEVTASYVKAWGRMPEPYKE